MKNCLLPFILTFFSLTTVGQDKMVLHSGRIGFTSEAPLEIISASVSQFQAVIDLANSQFAVSIPVGKFNGFNSALQQEHFHENYMESERYPKATFAGKVIGLQRHHTGPFSVIFKGDFILHGVTRQRWVEASCLWREDGTLDISANFLVPLADHGIEIPRVVYQKIAENIKVELSALMIQKP